ncbi:hypothetical protein N8I77_008673 [Diaporthe amygdali]|uniref:Uncharacterized protein n=1 Tax=Phomopsis amygdali TaxID=1214568 RepID=A0AAD9S894_PHOAM|nr:hypothetical protein N8I77_008673 [Diaporthe amygdali]
MPAKAQTVLTALLLAYSALGAPINNDQQIELQSVIDALKVQVEGLDLPFPSSIIDDVESTLKAKGVLDAKTLAALNKKIDALTGPKGLDSEDIASEAIDYLTDKGAFAETDEKKVKDKVVYLTTDLIKEVLSKGVYAVQRRDCPHKGRICGGCVIL